MQLRDGARSWRKSVDDGFDTLEGWTAAAVAVFLIFQAAIMIANVIARQMGTDIAIANSTAQALIVWITFFVAAHQAREDEHFDIDFLHRRFPDSVRQLNDILLKSIAFLFAVTFLLSAILITADTYRETAATGFPKFLLYSPAMLGGVLLTVEYLRQLVRAVVAFRG